MSRRYRARKDRRENWYDERVNMTFSQWSLRDYVRAPRPAEDGLPVADIREFHRFKEDDWYAQQAEA